MAKNIEINIKGSDGNYEVLYPKTNSSTTVINQNIINQFGLAEGSGLEDVLSELGKYNEYWWRRRVAGGEKYIEVRNDIPSNKIRFLGNFKYGHNITIDQNTGTYNIIKEGSYNINTWRDYLSAMQDLSSRLPCYVYGKDGVAGQSNWYYIPQNANWATSTGSTDGTFCYYNFYDDDYDCCLSGYASIKAQIISTKKVIQPAGEWEYLHSLNRNAYPNSGIQDGYEYEYLGVPFDNSVNALEKQKGSYVGTGKYGASNPNTLTFGFVPKFVFVSSVGTNSSYFLWVQGCNGTSGEYNDHLSVVVVSGNTLSWYNTNNEISQRNIKDVTYYYIAIG